MYGNYVKVGKERNSENRKSNKSAVKSPDQHDVDIVISKSYF